MVAMVAAVAILGGGAAAAHAGRATTSPATRVSVAPGERWEVSLTFELESQ